MAGGRQRGPGGQPGGFRCVVETSLAQNQAGQAGRAGSCQPHARLAADAESRLALLASFGGGRNMIREVSISRRVAPPSEAMGLNPVLARVLAARGQFQAPDYSLPGLLAPTLNGLDLAADILATAIREGERILVVGDFDADGATGTALAVRALRSLGARDVDWRVPDRFRHGYGLSPALVEEIESPAP